MSRSKIAILATAALFGISCFETLSAEDTTSGVTSGCGKERGDTDDVEQLRRAELSQYCLQLSLAHREWLAGYPTRARQLLNKTSPQYRGWAFDHLSHRFDQEVRSLTASEHTDFGSPHGVRHVTFSPDGKQLAAACDDLRIKLWDAASGKKLLDFHNETRTVDFSPDGRHLATGLSSTVSLLDAMTGEVTRRLSVRSGIGGIALRVQYSFDGQILAATDSKRGVRVWNTKTGKSLHHFEDIERVFRLTPDGTRLAVVHRRPFTPDRNERPTEILLRDVKTGEIADRPEFRFRHSVWYVDDMDFSPDGSQLAVACRMVERPTLVVVFDVDTGEILEDLRGHTAAVSSVRFSPDGSRLATGSRDKTVRLWDMDTGGQQFVLRGHSAAIHSVAWHPNGLQLASASDDGQIKLWDLTTSPDGYRYSITRHASPSRGTAVAVTGDHLATEGRRFDDQSLRWISCVHLWSPTTGALRETLKLPNQFDVADLVLSADGSHLATLLAQRKQVPGPTPIKYRLGVWDLVCGRQRQVLDRELDGFGRLAFSPDGERLATITCVERQENSSKTKMRLEIIEYQTGRRLIAESTHIEGRAWPTSLVYDPDGDRIAATFRIRKAVNQWEGAMVVWRADNGQRLALLNEPRGPVRRAAFRRGGPMIAAAVNRARRPARGGIEVWDVERQTRCLSIKAHTGQIEDVVFSPCANLIVSSGFESGAGTSQLRFWHVVSGQQVLNFDLSVSGAIERVAFLTPGQHLFTLDGRGTVRLLEQKTPLPPARFERAAVKLVADWVAWSWLDESPQLACEMRERLDRLAFSEEVHCHAAKMVSQVSDDPHVFAYWSWRESLQPDGSPDRYRRALQLAKFAGQQEPHKAHHLMVQALAEYRLENYQQAWQTLAKADQRADGGAADLCLRAMLQHRLGKGDEAVQTFSDVQAALKDIKSTGRRPPALLREAAQTIGIKQPDRQSPINGSTPRRG